MMPNRPDPPRRLPLGLIGLIALIAAVESGLGRLDRSLLSPPTAGWRQAGAAVTGEQVLEADLLCLGDSLVKTGVMPTVLETRLGIKFYNLAVLGGSVQSSFILLRRALEAGAKPRAILIDVQPSLFMWNTPKANVREWAEMATLREVAELGFAERDPDLIVLYLLQKALNSVRLRYDLRPLIVSTLLGEPPRTGPSALDLVERVAATNRGGFLNPIHPRRSNDDPRLDAKLPSADDWYYYPKEWFAAPRNQQYLEKCLSLASARGIDIYFLLPPVHSSHLAELERRGIDAKYMKLVKWLARHYPRMSIVDARRAILDPRAYFDGSHLDRAGAVAFSRELARAMDDHLAAHGRGSRWIELRSQFETHDDPGLEDFGQAGTSLLEPTTVRR